MQHPAVLEAAVIGKEDADGLTKTKAYRGAARTASRSSDDELKAFVKERLAPYKYPRFIEFVDELPKTATGKIQRFRLREREAARRRARDERRDAEFAAIRWRGRDVRIEYAAHRARAQRRAAGRLPARRPRLGRDVEGLPRSTCATPAACAAWCSRAPATAARRRAPPTRRWDVDFMHRQAHEVLPAFFDAHRPRTKSPGSSATATAARSRCCTRRDFPTRVAGLVVLAPHIFVEDVTVANIEQARKAYLDTDLRAAPRRATTTMSTPPSGAGTASGCTRPSAHGTSRPSSTPSAARCWRCRASTTSTARWHRSAASRARVPQTQLLEIRRLRAFPAPRPARNRSISRRRVRTIALTSTMTTGVIHTMSHRIARTTLTALAAAPASPRSAHAQQGKLKVGLMLPYSGTYTALGVAIENGFKLLRRRAGRQARRARDRIRQGRRRVRPGQGHRQRQQAHQARQRRRDHRHRALGRGDGDGQGRQGKRHRADRAQRRRRRGDRPDVRARTSSAARSPTGSRPTPWAKSRPSRARRRR